MSIVFSADEIFEMAEQIERNGAAFYRNIAKKAGSDDSRKVLIGLAEMEDQHLKVFADMRAKLSSKETTPTVFDPDNEEQLYLRSMVEGKIFDADADASKVLTGQETMEDILKTAIGLEKDSIIFYLNLKGMIPTGGVKDRIDQIIKEEIGHITTLNKEKASLKAEA